MTVRATSMPSLLVDYTIHRDNDSLLSDKKPSYYPFKIPSHHQQLRHYISTVDADVLYFISNNEVHAIDLPTDQRERIASLSFVPTCLGAGHGWLCIGGYNKGQCAFIDLRDAPPFGRPIRRTAEVDELLPLDLDPHSRILTQDQSRQDHRAGRRPAKVVTKDIGTLIVNAITVHKFVQKNKDIEEETVAILSNNDKSVTVYSLNQHTVLKTLPFPIYMNHATISPDGKILLAVGDQGRAFFLRRKSVSKSKSPFPVYDWEELASVRLSGTSAKDCCFSTAFSPSGHLCAVASQFGTITVYDAKKIREDMEDDEAVVDILRGSRMLETGSSFIPGAPRSMAFSPEPWDMLVWAEDHGKVCIADLRDGFRSRHTVNLNLDDEAVERIELADADASPSAEQLDMEHEASLVRRHQDAIDAQDHIAAVQSAADYMENAAERRRRRVQLLNMQGFGDEPSLSEAEREILEALRIQRSQATAADASNDRDGRPFSINYSNHSSASHSPSSANLPISFGQYVSNRGNNRSSPGNAHSSTHSAWGYPRRRGSVVISSTQGAGTGSSSHHPSSLMPGPSAPLSASPSRLTPTLPSESQAPPTRDTPPSPLAMPSGVNEQWQTISAAMASIQQDSPSSSARNSGAEINYTDVVDPARMTAMYTQSILRRASEAREHRRSGADSSTAEASRETSNELFRRVHERERERELALRRERLRAIHATSNETEAEARIERLQRLRASRYRQFRERTGLGLGELAASMGEEDLAFLQELSHLVEQGHTDREPHSRINGEVGVQGVGWSHDGRYLFVGTEEGILRYDVNIRSRMTFPGITMS